MRTESPAEQAACRWRAFRRWQRLSLLAAVLIAGSLLLLPATAARDTPAPTANGQTAGQTAGPDEARGSTTSEPTDPEPAEHAAAVVTLPDESAPDRSVPDESAPWVRHPQQVELPTAPPPFARWIELGTVQFDFYDPQREPFDFAAETRFRFHYSYRCQTRWRLVDAAEVDTEVDPGEPPTAAAGERWLEVRPVYDEVTLTVSHRVRLPADLAGPGFYEHPLVRHEFDHIAISADPGLLARLRRMLEQRNELIVQPLPPATHVPESEQHARHERLNRLADAAVRRESDRVFQRFMQAVAIRYRELDQVTAHGRRPLSAADRYRLIDSPAGK